MLIIQSWNNLTEIKSIENLNKQPTEFRVLVFSFNKQNNLMFLEFCWETNNFVINADNLCVKNLPQELVNKPAIYCVISDCCSIDYAKQYLQAMNWSENPIYLDPEYFQ